MASQWEIEMQEKFDKLQQALTEEFRTQLMAMGELLEERLEERLDKRLSHRLQVQMEELRVLVRDAAEGYGATLEKIDRELGEFRSEWRNKGEDTDRVLTDHVNRIVALERATGLVRE
jgi:hypothetical protein